MATNINPNPFSTRAEIEEKFGVASDRWIAIDIGMGILERGGNAFEAAAAPALENPNFSVKRSVPMLGSSCETIT